MANINIAKVGDIFISIKILCLSHSEIIIFKLICYIL